MANEGHLAKLKEGVEAWNQWREEEKITSLDLSEAYLYQYQLPRINLGGVHLEKTMLWSAQLQEANLGGANLQKASLSRAQLQGAQLGESCLQETHMVEAQLQEADLLGVQARKVTLFKAQLYKANLWQACLDESDLRGAQFHETNLKEATLRKADLRGAEYIRFDDTNIEGIRVDLRFGKFLERLWNPRFIKKPRAIPWIELRRAYTGVNFLLTLVALLAFLFPYVLQAGYLQALNWFQATLVETTPILKESLESVNETTPLVNPTSSLVSYLENLTPCFAQECKSRPIVWLILGGNQGIFLVIFNILLIAYNALRFYVTQTISILRDEEEQGGWSPKKSEVDRLIPLHIAIKFLFFAAVASGLINALVTLFKVVQVPA